MAQKQEKLHSIQEFLTSIWLGHSVTQSILFPFFQFEQKKQKEPVPERGKRNVLTLPARSKCCRLLLGLIWIQIVWLFAGIPEIIFGLSLLKKRSRQQNRLISVVDVVITPMNPYQPIPFHILSFAVFQSRILIYAGSNIYDL